MLACIRPNKKDGKPLAHRRGRRYTRRTRSQSLRVISPDIPKALEPLREGKPVILAMTLPRIEGNKRRSEGKPVPIVITPGPIIGAPSGVYLVSVVGKGAAVVGPYLKASLAHLVLAGIPVRLSTALMDEFRRMI